MQGRLERLIKIAYRGFKSEQAKPDQAHPDEETLACFLEGRLPQAENEEVKLHLLSCDNCARVFAIQSRLALTPREEKEVPPELMELVKNLLNQEEAAPLLEILLRFKEKAIELINTTGDVLVGQELVPAPVLRSRSVKDFKDEVTILKDFNDIRIQIKIENKGGEAFNLKLIARQKHTQKVIKDLRVTLLKDDLELESYLTDSGSVIFEHVLLGKYRLEMSAIENKLASILLDIKV
ncbi:MAG: hypothetical protein NT066_02340 [Candidatus Omnitrophica bacterium]|nr:hypothetical protein [Candidatus Omnitrophota bacterium]